MKTKILLCVACCFFALFSCNKDNSTNPNNNGNNNNNRNNNGSICFWSDASASHAGGVTVYVDGNLAGTYNSYSPTGTAPACGASGFLTVSLSPGTHYFTARSGSGYTWNSTSFVISAGLCSAVNLNYKMQAYKLQIFKSSL